MEKEIDTGDAALKREPWTVRVAVWSASHRWPVLAAWFVLTIGLMVGSVALGGQRAESILDKGKTIGDSQTGFNVLSDNGNANAVTTESFYLIVESNSGPLNTPANVAAINDMSTRLASLTVNIDGKQVPAFYTDPQNPLSPVVNPYVLAAAVPDQAASVLSADGTTAIVTAKISGDDIEATAKADVIKPLADQFKADYPNLTVYAFNNRLINADFGKYINSSLDGLLLPTLIITFFILLVASRSAIAAFVPIVLALSAIIGAMGLTGIYSQVVAPISQYVVQIVVLIGLAVAVDYSLFVISRFRTERLAGRDKLCAIEIASSTAGRAVFFSGLAVMISVAGLFILPDTLFRSMALGTISVIAVAVAGSLTFLPALLAILGDRVDRGRVPVLGRTRPTGGGWWARLVEAVVHRPVISALGAAAVLLILAGPVTHLRLGNSDVTSFPESIDGVQAIEVLQAHWPAGTILALQVVVTDANTPATQAAIVKLEQTGLTVTGLSGPATVTPSGDGTVAMVSFVMSGTENDPANWQAVRDMRTTVVPQVLAQAPGAAAYVTGNAAVSLDQTQVFTDGMIKIFLFVLGLSFLLLLAVFRSLVIPLKAIVLNLLSTGAAYGVLVLVFQDGFLGGPLGVRPSEVIQNWVPVFVFTILFGLSMDYEVFILTRVKEWHDGGLDTHRAVARGIAETAGTVTSAAAIMVVVFAVFVTLRLVIIRELGLGLAVAVFLDATVIRAILLPASMRLLGEWNWYLPRFLRWLPRITIETPSRPEAGSPGPHATA